MSAEAAELQAQSKSFVAAPAGVRLGRLQLSTKAAVALGCAVVLLVGTVGGLVAPTRNVPEPWNYISGVIGWTYFSAWSISFYPQFYLNWVRKSVVGMSFDYQLLNVVGFASYSIFNCALYYSGTVQAEYYEEHHANNVVAANDVFFALHALFWTLLTFGQIFMYDRGGQRIHYVILFISVASMIVFTVYGIILLGWEHPTDTDATGFRSWLTYVTTLSYIKLGVTLIKYTPQAHLNWKRKCTIGWNIWNVLLDFTGGSLSVAQQLIDCAVTGNWSGISGDPVKFGLGMTSMVFDIVFMTQHYILYAHNNRCVQQASDGARYGDDQAGREKPESALLAAADGSTNAADEWAPI